MSAITLLRSRTAAAHEGVDAAFGGHNLHDRAAYQSFLEAHARALPTAEARAAVVWPLLRPRTPLLAEDLSALGADLEMSVASVDGGVPEQWGALYVVEGSRLGGGILAGRVGAGLPHTYLAATHEPGEWRTIRAAIDAAADGKDTAWHDALVAGALDTFGLYSAAKRVL